MRDLGRPGGTTRARPGGPSAGEHRPVGARAARTRRRRRPRRAGRPAGGRPGDRRAPAAAAAGGGATAPAQRAGRRGGLGRLSRAAGVSTTPVFPLDTPFARCHSSSRPMSDQKGAKNDRHVGEGTGARGRIRTAGGDLRGRVAADRGHRGMLLLLLELREEAPGLTVAMLLPGVRLVERPGALHFFDGRRVVSIRGDEAGRRTLRRAAAESVAQSVAGPTVADDAAADEDARRLLDRLRLGSAEPESELTVSAAYATAAVGGWTSGLEAQQRLADVTVHVWSSGPGLARALADSGLTVSPIDGPEHFAGLDPRRSVVAVVADADQPVRRLRAANEACLAAGLTWLPVGAYDGATILVGPLIVPRQSACAECLLRRLAANVAYADVFADVVAAPAAPTPPALQRWAESITTLVLRCSTGSRTGTHGCPGGCSRSHRRNWRSGRPRFCACPAARPAPLRTSSRRARRGE